MTKPMSKAEYDNFREYEREFLRATEEPAENLEPLGEIVLALVAAIIAAAFLLWVMK